MPVRTLLTERWRIAHPIIQAPMAGGPATPVLAAAVSESGGLGFLGAAYLSPEQIDQEAAAVRSRTSRPFGINLFAPLPPPDFPDPGTAIHALAPFHAELGLAPPVSPSVSAAPTDLFELRLAAALESGASVLSFTFGLLPDSAIRAIRDRGLFLMGTATTVDEAIALEAAGVDAVVAQGSEAGAHRGTFAGPFEDALIGTMALVPQVVDAVSVPVVASGGIMDGRGIAAALALGAGGVQMGTAFLTCREAGTSAAYREALLAAREDETRVTRAFSGRPARGIVNRLMEAIEATADAGGILPFPLQNALTRPLRIAADRLGRAECLSLWAGQGVRMGRSLPAGELVRELVEETDRAIRRLSTG